MKNTHKIFAVVSTILLSVGMIAPASAAEPETTRQSITIPFTIPEPIPLSVPADVPVSFDRQMTTSVAHIEAPVEAPVVEVAAVVEAPAVPLTEAAPALPQTYTAVATEPVHTAPAPAVVAAPAAAPVIVAAPAPAPAPVGSGNGGLAGSALSQLGIAQDCTAMVERALGSIGIVTGDIAPADFLRFGRIVPVSDMQSGDILVYPGHVAIAIGNGQAVHGGFDGTTAIASAFISGTPTVVRVG